MFKKVISLILATVMITSSGALVSFATMDDNGADQEMKVVDSELAESTDEVKATTEEGSNPEDSMLDDETLDSNTPSEEVSDEGASSNDTTDAGAEEINADSASTQIIKSTPKLLNASTSEQQQNETQQSGAEEINADSASTQIIKSTPKLLNASTSEQQQNETKQSGDDANTNAEPEVKKEVAAPDNVKTFTATSKETYILLKWKAVSDADGYIITWSGNGVKNKKIVIDNGSICTHKVRVKVKDVKRYTFNIKAYRNDGSTKKLSPKSKVAYVPAISLRVKTTTAGTVTLSWTVTKDYKNAGNYKVCKRVAGKYKAVKRNIKVKKSKDGKYMTATFKDTGLGGGKSYIYYIRDVNSRAKSNVVTAKTPLANVKNFEANSSYNAVLLTWKKVARADGYTISWAGNGKKGKIKINKGSTTSYLHTIPANCDFTYSIVANEDGYKSSRVASKCTGTSVRTMYYSVMFATDRELYSHTGGSVYAYFPAGTWITATGFTQGKYIFWHRGLMYYVSRISMSNASVSHHDVGKTYSIKEAESFVNRRGLYSNTSYLIWVNTYTQKEYVFFGSKGNWKCVKGPWIVTTGHPSSPTETGLTTIRQKDPQEHDSYYWSVCSSYSIHSKPASQHQDLGWPFSGSCVRNEFDNAKWIYYNCEIGTGVYVF